LAVAIKTIDSVIRVVFTTDASLLDNAELCVTCSVEWDSFLLSDIAGLLFVHLLSDCSSRSVCRMVLYFLEHNLQTDTYM